MMAPAMAERRPEQVTYRELGERDAALARTLEAVMLPRLGDQGTLITPASIQLEFTLFDRKPQVHGRASVRMSLPCQWCDRSLERDVAAEFSALLALDEEEAKAWDQASGDRHVIVTAGEHLDVSSLVEDELLLSLPARVCIDDGCPWRPKIAERDSQGQNIADKMSPFAAMADLLRK